MKLKALAAALLVAAPVFANAAPYTLFAGNNLTLEQGVKISGDAAAKGNFQGKINSEVTGNLIGGGTVTLEQNAKINGNVSSGGKVSLNIDSKVGGNVATSSGANVAVAQGQNSKVSGTVTHRNGTQLTKNIGASNGGEVFANVAAPTFAVMPEASAFEVGSNAFNLNAYGNGAIGGGKYGNVNIGYDSTLTLTAGTYYFNSLNVSSESKFVFDLSGGEIKLYIKGNVNIGSNFDFVMLNGDANDIYAETKGNWEQGAFGEWYGTLFASGADSNLHFNQGSLIGGNFMARKNIQLDLNTAMSAMPQADSPAAEVPVPGSLPLMAVGLVALIGLRRRKAG